MFLDLLFPKFCIQCNKSGTYLCPKCASQITRHKQICIVCQRLSNWGKTHKECQRSTPLNGIIIATEYKQTMRKALHKIKYNLNYAILEELLQKTLLSEKIKYCLKQEEITLCTEIPMHKQKLNTRGFNQAQMIAKWLEKRYKLEYSQLLIKTKQTTPQMQLHRFDRYLNLKDAFQLNPKLDISQQLQKKSVLIVDDVTTTGTTLEECAKLLKKQGIQKIWGLVLASGK